METLTPIIYRSSVLIYNKSHVPAIMDFARSEEHPLASTAHEILKEMSAKTPEVFKAHIRELCKVVQEQAPSTTKANEPGAVDTLKTCAGFARKFPQELPKDRKFLQCLIEFALHGTPPQAAKHAVSILLAISERRAMHAKDLVQRCIKGFTYGSDAFLSRLAALSQLMLLAPKEVEGESDVVVDIAINQILLKVRSPSENSDYDWEDKVDDECEAKMWALKILVNRLRSHEDPSTLKDVAVPVYRLLRALIVEDGELSKAKDTPYSHKPRLRLLAAQLYLKLCTQKVFNDLLPASDFNRLALVAQDVLYPVRFGFVSKLQKYLGQHKLPQRFYSILFLLAFDPQDQFREEALTWIRSRSAMFAQQNSTVMEAVFARLLSLLAHHPDYGTGVDDLLDSARYIMFYLGSVATEQNLSLIYHIAQRVKQKRDAIHPDVSENLYHLSDLAQALIRRYEDVHGWSLQTFPHNLRLPSELFASIPNQEQAQEVARKTYLPDGLTEKLDALVKVKGKAKAKKRKSDDPDDAPARKKTKSSGTSGQGTTSASVGNKGSKTLPVRKSSGKPAAKSPKAKKKAATEADSVPSSERRRSGRGAAAKTYAERDDEEDDEEMELLNQDGAGEDEDEDGVYVEGKGEEMEVESYVGAERTSPKSKAKAKATGRVNGHGKGKGHASRKTGTRPKAGTPTIPGDATNDNDDAEDDEEALSDPPSGSE